MNLNVKIHPLRQSLIEFLRESDDFKDNICVSYDDNEATAILSYEQCKTDILRLSEDLKNLHPNLCLIGLQFSDNACEIIKIVPAILAISLHPHCSFVVLDSEKPDQFKCTHMIGEVSH